MELITILEKTVSPGDCSAHTLIRRVCVCAVCVCVCCSPRYGFSRSLSASVLASKSWGWERAGGKEGGVRVPRPARAPAQEQWVSSRGGAWSPRVSTVSMLRRERSSHNAGLWRETRRHTRLRERGGESAMRSGWGVGEVYRFTGRPSPLLSLSRSFSHSRVTHSLPHTPLAYMLTHSHFRLSFSFFLCIYINLFHHYFSPGRFMILY